VVRDVLLGVHAVAWLVVVLLTVWRTGELPPAELWAALPLGVGAILGAFRADAMMRRRRTGEADDE
jgi:hypothetical protein